MHLLNLSHIPQIPILCFPFSACLWVYQNTEANIRTLLSKCGSQVSSINDTLGLIRHVVSDLIPDQMNQNLYFTEILRQYICTLKFDMHCSRAHIFFPHTNTLMHTLLAISKFLCISSHLPDVSPSIPEEKTSSSVPKLSSLHLGSWLIQSLFKDINSLPFCLKCDFQVWLQGINCTYLVCLTSTTVQYRVGLLKSQVSPGSASFKSGVSYLKTGTVITHPATSCYNLPLVFSFSVKPLDIFF